MSITGIHSSQGSIGLAQPSFDRYENNIKKQISALEEKMKAISNDEDKPAEEKTKERQAAQEQLQNLNQELRECQLRKQQEEAQRKQEAAKEALASVNEPDTSTVSTGFGGKEAGVMITLSSAQEQLSGMVRLRTSLEGRQRTASTPEEKADLQKKIDRVSRGIGKKISSAENILSDYRKTGADTTDDRKKPITTAQTVQAKEEVFWADTKPKPASADSSQAASTPFNGNKPFDNVSLSIS